MRRRYLREENDIPMTLTRDQMYNPDKVDFKSMFRGRKQSRDDEIARQAAEKRKQELRDKYADVLNQIDSSKPVDEILDFLFNELVPGSGKADTVAGELVRAMERIMYRDYNDGDLFYTGYGKETCASDAAYIAENVPNTFGIFVNIAQCGYDDDQYTDALDEIAEIVINYILDNPETLDTSNETDSRTEFGDDYWDDYEPTYEFEVEMNQYIQDLCDSDNDYDYEDFTEWLRGFDILWNGAELNDWARDAWTFENLSKEQLQELEDNFYEWQNHYEDDLRNEYGDEYSWDEEEE